MRNNKSILCIIVCMLIFNSALNAQTDNDILLKQKKFIKELYQENRYFDCISETRRLLSLQNIDNKESYEYFIQANYYLGRQYKTVIDNVESTYRDNGFIYYLFLLAESYAKLGYVKEGIKTLNRIYYDQLTENAKEQLFLRRINLLINGYDYESIINEINAHNFNFLYSHEMKRDINEQIDKGQKSKWLSATLSALCPGAGQLYSGKLPEGAISLAAVAAGAFGSYYLYKKDEKQLSFTLAFFTCLFYTGNIYGAYNSADSYNRQSQDKFNSRFNEKYNLPQYDPLIHLDKELYK